MVIDSVFLCLTSIQLCYLIIPKLRFTLYSKKVVEYILKSAMLSRYLISLYTSKDGGHILKKDYIE